MGTWSSMRKLFSRVANASFWIPLQRKPMVQCIPIWFSLILGLFVCLFFNISYLFTEVQGRLTHSWRAARSYLFWIMYSLQLSWEKIFLENVMFVQYQTQTWKCKYCSWAWCMGTPSGLCVILGAGFRSGTLFKWNLGFFLRLPC